MMTMFAVAIILENVFVLGFSADTRSIETRLRDPPSDARARHRAADLCHRLRNFGRPDPRRALVDFAHRLRARSARQRGRRASRRNAWRRRQARSNADLRAWRGLRRRRRNADRRCLPVRTVQRRAHTCSTASRSSCSAVSAMCSVRWSAAYVLGFLQSLGGLTLGDGYRDLVGMALFLLVLAFRPDGFLARRAIMKTNRGLVEVGVPVGRFRPAVVRAQLCGRLRAADRLSRVDLSDACRKLEPAGGFGGSRFARYVLFRWPRGLCRLRADERLRRPAPAGSGLPARSPEARWPRLFRRRSFASGASTSP